MRWIRSNRLGLQNLNLALEPRVLLEGTFIGFDAASPASQSLSDYFQQHGQVGNVTHDLYLQHRYAALPPTLALDPALIQELDRLADKGYQFDSIGEALGRGYLNGQGKLVVYEQGTPEIEAAHSDPSQLAVFGFHSHSNGTAFSSPDVSNVLVGRSTDYSVEVVHSIPDSISEAGGTYVLARTDDSPVYSPSDQETLKSEYRDLYNSLRQRLPFKEAIYEHIRQIAIKYKLAFYYAGPGTNQLTLQNHHTQHYVDVGYIEGPTGSVTTNAPTPSAPTSSSLPAGTTTAAPPSASPTVSGPTVSGATNSEGNEAGILLSRTGLQASQAGATQQYEIQVQQGETVRITLSGGAGDADLYVRRGGPATRSNNDDMSEGFTNEEVVTINDAAEGTYYITVRAWKPFSGVSLVAERMGIGNRVASTTTAPTVSPLSQNGVESTPPPAPDNVTREELQAALDLFDGEPLTGQQRGLTATEKEIVVKMVTEFARFSATAADPAAARALADRILLVEYDGSRSLPTPTRGRFISIMPTVLFLSTGVYETDGFEASGTVNSNNTTFKHEMIHLLSNAGLVPNDAANGTGPSDDYNPVPELWHGASVDALQGEDLAVFGQNLVGNERLVGAWNTYQTSDGETITDADLLREYLTTGNFNRYRNRGINVPVP